MFERPWVRWLGVLLAIHVIGAGLALATALTGSTQAANWTVGLTALAALAWSAIGAWRLWDSRLVRGIAIGYFLLVVAGLVYRLNQVEQYSASFAVAGVIAMAASFFGGLWLIRLLLAPGLPNLGVTGVARAVVDEAIHMKVAMIFIVMLLVVVPALPTALDTRDLLRYRIQFFLTWSFIFTSFLLSLMTIFLACKTVTSEIDRKQIFLTLTKPVSRVQYLLGKWLGIVLLDGLLLAVAGGGIYTFVKVLEYSTPDTPRAAAERQVIRDQVLVARQAIRPEPADGSDLKQVVLNWVAQRRREAPDAFGQPGDPIDPDKLAEWSTQLLARWHTIMPRNGQAFLFTGLDDAGRFGPLQLRLKPRSSRSPPDGVVHLRMVVNGRERPLPPLADDNVHVINIDPRLVDDQGRLVVELVNSDPRGAETTFLADISFTPGNGLEVLYRVGPFETNFLRALAIFWVRLAFLAMLGIAAATFLGFPVASLLCLMVYFTAAGSGYLNESLSYYSVIPRSATGSWDWLMALFASLGTQLSEGKVWEAVKVLITLLGQIFVGAVPSFSTYNPVPALADGKLVSGGLLLRALLNVGLIWSGVCVLIAWLIFRKRELARITV